MRKIFKYLIALAIGLALFFGIYNVYREKPVPVDLGMVSVGDMQVTISEEGKTRVREIYTVSAPIDGYISRVQLDEGQYVKANETVITAIHPLEPPFIDERTRDELQSQIKAAELGVSLARVQLSQSQTALELATSEHRRANELARKKVIAMSALEKTFSTLRLAEADVESSKAAVRLREAELESVKARMRQPGQGVVGRHSDQCCVQIKAPVSGVVLKVNTRSEQAVRAGTAIAEIGDPQRLEIIVDLLSNDAARIEEGAEVEITEWGGERPLAGKVRRVDPAAFTKVSALGIEEQRVNVVIDIDDVPTTLGHGFQVLTKLKIWQGEDVLQVPISALFRTGGEWSVFKFEEGTAHLTRIEIGRINDEYAQVLSGLDADQRVVLFPSDKLTDGSPIAQR